VSQIAQSETPKLEYLRMMQSSNSTVCATDADCGECLAVSWFSSDVCPAAVYISTVKCLI
jgi:hypothetical protein